MSYPGEYSIKSPQRNPSHHRGTSSGSRFMNLLRSLFRPHSKKYPEISAPIYASIPPRPASTTIKRRKTEPPVRSSSHYENLSNFRDLVASNYTHVHAQAPQMSLSETHFPKPVVHHPVVVPSHIAVNQSPFYTPQIKRANHSNFYSHSMGVQDIRIVNLDPQPTQLVRTLSYRRPEERYVIQGDRRPIYSESVEVNIAEPPAYRVIQQAPRVMNPQYLLPSSVSESLEKRVVSVANIPVEIQHSQSDVVRMPNSIEKEITLKREYSDTINQQMEYSSLEESRKKMEIKERILAEWEHNWRHKDRKLDGSFSSTGTSREEPSMVSSIDYPMHNCLCD